MAFTAKDVMNLREKSGAGMLDCKKALQDADGDMEKAAELLRERGMTAKELCAQVGITEANLSILRSGKAKGVRFATINRICYYLDCDVGDILKFDGNLEEDE